MSSGIVQEFVERMGLAAEADGLPRIAGRIFAFFVLDGGTRSFSEVAERLQVSRGSVSTNARLLESLGVLERITRPGDRQAYFRLTPDPYGRLLEGTVDRMRRVEELIQRTLAALPKSKKGTAARLREMERFYRTAAENTESVLDQWRQRPIRRKRT